MKFEYGFLLDHHPGNPRVGYSQQHKQANNGAGSDGEELNAQSEGKKHTGSKCIDGPFQAHVERFGCTYLICIQNGVHFMHSIELLERSLNLSHISRRKKYG